MNDETLQGPQEIKSFLDGTQSISLHIEKEKRYDWITHTLKNTKYLGLKRKDKSIVFTYMLKVTHYSRSQLRDLIRQYKIKSVIGCHIQNKTQFPKHYTRADILLLIETDKAHENLSGLLTKKLFERAYKKFNDNRYRRLYKISCAHIYNLRKGDFYKRQRHNIDKTKRSSVTIGVRKKPQPNGEPGYIRIDTVHQGDLDKTKGVYHINAVDEVTQFEAVGSVEKISEHYLIPILEDLLLSFPFKIRGFHSDNGSEYVNKVVAKLLRKLHIEFTKSRPRHSGDNGLTESKNGSVVRKTLGYIHIPQRYADLINKFNKEFFIPYLNYHRPCYFPQEKIEEHGKVKKIYIYENVMTPYEKLKSLNNPEQYLKEGVSFKDLDAEEIKMNDLESAKQMYLERNKLFKEIFSEEE